MHIFETANKLNATIVKLFDVETSTEKFNQIIDLLRKVNESDDTP